MSKIVIVNVEPGEDGQMCMERLRCSACCQLFLLPLTFLLPIACPFEDKGAIVLDGALCTFVEQSELEGEKGNDDAR